jgi:hypothetical protein
VPYSLVEIYRRFRGVCCLHHQGVAHLQTKKWFFWSRSGRGYKITNDQRAKRYLRFSWFKVMKMLIIVLWVVTPCNPVGGYQRLSPPTKLHSVTTQDHNQHVLSDPQIQWVRNNNGLDSETKTLFPFNKGTFRVCVQCACIVFRRSWDQILAMWDFRFSRRLYWLKGPRCRLDDNIKMVLK